MAALMRSSMLARATFCVARTAPVASRCMSASSGTFPFPACSPAPLADPVKLAEDVQTALEKQGFTKDNTLLAVSQCPDEVNANDPKDLVPLLRNDWGGFFAIGGLAGIPFTGKTGWGAFFHHVANGGNILLMYASHIGETHTVDDPDCPKLGSDQFPSKYSHVLRAGQSCPSTCCGSAVAGYHAALAGQPVPDGPYDAQQRYVQQRLVTRLDEIKKAGGGDPDRTYAYLGMVMFEEAQEFARHSIDLDAFFAEEKWADSKVAVLGGIQYNRDDGKDDSFVPLAFEMFTASERTDLLDELSATKNRTSLPTFGWTSTLKN